ncbi:unnamed protein product [Peronospora belbahrii]|uniref:PX domain-containing protein n=1 Tax=Peronospora belbahrii TaxID=622444 RepID=A0ABN8D9W3_9STRA|nr:unnamed protein product [Peronospora belbahrii]
MNHTTLQRHPKCSAFYASHLRRDSEALRPTEAWATSVTYLANVTVEVTTKALTRDASTFAITVHDTKSSSTWRHLRSYTECRAFQSRILEMLSRGHLCFAECPWLYAYVQRALPGEHRYRHLFLVAGQSSKPRVVENQRQALARLFTTLQRVLLNPLNQKCTVLMQQVALEVITFITNQIDVNGRKPLSSPLCDRQLAKTFSEAYMFDTTTVYKKMDERFQQTSTTTTASLEDLDKDYYVEENDSMYDVNNVVAGQRVCCAMCALQNERSDEQVFAYWRAKTMSSHHTKIRAKSVARWASIVGKRPLQMRSQTQQNVVWESPAFSQRVTSPLEIVAAQIDQYLNTPVTMEHDGTPKDPFPGSACTPRTLKEKIEYSTQESIASSSTASSVCEFNFEMLDNCRLSSAVPSPMEDADAASAIKMSRCSGVKNIRRMPFRSLLILNQIRNKFRTKHCTGSI